MVRAKQLHMANQQRQQYSKGRAPRMVDDVALLELLGHGAYAKVYLGKQVKTGALVAVKNVNVSQPHKRKSVEVETDALRRLNHRNVVKLHKVVQHNDVASLVLEYLPSPDLLTHLNESGAFSEMEARLMMLQLVDAVKHCHTAGIAHHDIKPENVSYDRASKVVKLFDFGLAIAHQNGDEPCTSYSGSPLYLAPEVINATPYNPFAVDVWAIGVLLYELLTNSVPFEAQTWDELVALMNDPNQRIYYPKFFSAELVQLLSRMLDTNPETRITLAEVQAHPWMTGVDDDSDDEDFYAGALDYFHVGEFPIPMDVDHAHTTVVA